MLSEYGKLRGCTKPDVPECLESIEKTAYIKSKTDAVIIDEPTLVQMSYLESSLKRFGSYREMQLVNKVNSIQNRIGIFPDVYLEKSLENDTRESKGNGNIIST